MSVGTEQTKSIDVPEESSGDSQGKVEVLKDMATAYDGGEKIVP